MASEFVELVEAAASLRISYHAAHRWVLTGQLKGERRDGRWYVERRDLERLLAERRPTAKHRKTTEAE